MGMFQSTFRYGCIIVLVLLLWYTVDDLLSMSNIGGKNSATRNTSTLCTTIPKTASNANTVLPTGSTTYHHYDAQDSTSRLCQMIDSETSFPRVWENMIRQQILNVSLMEESDWNYNLRSQPNFVQWVHEAMQYFTIDKLQHTSMSQPLHSPSTIQHIQAIIERKLQHRQNPSIPPLRILIFGGSVTTGHECLENIFDFFVRKDGNDNGRKASADHEVKICAWPGRLQEMFNTILGQNIIEITNMATGGAQTEMSTTVLQFGLLPNNVIPDIIIWDHGINDAIVPVTTSTTTSTTTIKPKTSDLVTDNIFQKLQTFYQATIHLPKNEECQHSTEAKTTATGTTNPPPVVILLDTLLGHIEKFPYIVDSLTASAAVSKMIAWYPNIWGISYANTIRSYVLSHLVQKRESLPLLGMKGLYTHPGMMYHITLAWTMTFNIMQALHNNCVLQSIQREQEYRQQQQQQQQQQQTETDATSKSFLTTQLTPVYLPQSHELDVAQIPELTVDLLMMDVPYQWNERKSQSIAMHNETFQKCHQPPQQPRSSLRCYYAWIANRVLRIESPREIYEVIKENMVENKGWTSFHDDSKTSPGWVVKKGRNSYFELLFESVPITVESLTIIYMQSYSEKWYNSTLQVDASFEEYDDKDDDEEELNAAAPSTISKMRPQRGTSSQGNDDAHMANIDTTQSVATTTAAHSIRHLISGYHKEQTSILVPIQLPLLPVSASSSSSSVNRVNDSKQPRPGLQPLGRLRLRFQLINGENFKITGMAIC